MMIYKLAGNLGLVYMNMFSFVCMDQLLCIAFCIRYIYTRTNTLEYNRTKVTENTKMLEIRPMNTEIVFLASGGAHVVLYKA